MSQRPLVTVNADAAVRAFTQLAGQLRDLRPVLREFHAYHARQIDSVFKVNGRGGTHRGLLWADFAPSSLPHNRMRAGRRWYSARGGGERLSRPQATVGAMTLGARRPSGMRLTPQSKLLQDTGALRQSAATGVFVLSKDALMYGSDKDYATKQAETRPWYSFTDEDGAKLLAITRKALTAQAKAASGAGQ